MSETMKKIFSFALSFLLAVSILCGFQKEKIAKAASRVLNNPRTDDSGVTTWDCIYLGNYWQEDTNRDGTVNKEDIKQPIKWRVLSVNGDDVFLLADKNLDYQPYDDYDTYRDVITWEICTLRQWLNNDFYQNAFDSAEQSAIMTTIFTNEDNSSFGTDGGADTSDKVYLLSLNDMWNSAYGFGTEDTGSETREAENTAYIKSIKNTDDTTWWLRSPGGMTYFAATVMKNGDVGYHGAAVGTLHLAGAAESKNAVRPVLHMDLSSDKWSEAEPVSATIAERKREDDTSEGDTTAPNPGDKSSANTTQKGNEQVKPNSTIRVSDVLQKKEDEKRVNISKPSKVVFRSVKGKKGRKVSLSWKKVSGAKGYQLQYAQNKKFIKKKKSEFTTKTKVTVKKLKKKEMYYFRVCAYKLNGGMKVYGKWSKVKKVKVKK